MFWSINRLTVSLIFNWGDRIHCQRKAEKIRQKEQKEERIKELIYRAAMTSFIRSGRSNK